MKKIVLHVCVFLYVGSCKLVYNPKHDKVVMDVLCFCTVTTVPKLTREQWYSKLLLGLLVILLRYTSLGESLHVPVMMLTEPVMIEK